MLISEMKKRANNESCMSSLSKQQGDANWVNTASGDVHRIEAFLSDAAYSPHRHDTYAIGITLRGVQSFDYRGETKHSLPGGVVVLHPDELHDGRAGTSAGFLYRTIYVEPSLIQDAIDGDALPFVEGAVSSDERIFAALNPLLESYDHPLETLEYEDGLYELANALNAASGGAKRSPATNAKAAHKARQYIHEKLDSGVSMEELERVTGHDRWQLSRDFRKMFGTSPHRYQTMRRLDVARRCLRDGHSIADAAIAGAFADQSHFTRHFRKAFGLTPRAWLNAVQPAALI